MHVPPELEAERKALIAEIYEAFKGVSREGGVSWSEAWAIDSNGTDEKCAAAKTGDDERSWEDLVDDPSWKDTVGPWPFLDAIGFRYYLAPAMVRTAHGGEGAEFLAYALRHPLNECELRKLLTSRQHTALVRFIAFMERHEGNSQSGLEWRLLRDIWENR